MTTTKFFTMIAALIDKEIKSIHAVDATELKPVNDIEILLQYE